MTDHLTQGLVFSTPPYSNESLHGYLLRISESHKLRTPKQLIKLINNHPYKLPSSKDIENIVNLTGCHTLQIENLFGLEWRSSKGYRYWKIQNEKITKPYFILTSNLPYCKECLTEKPYLRDLWQLTYYQCCHIHKSKLSKECPHCKKPLKLLRPGVTRCNCNGDIRYSKQDTTDKFNYFLSLLIDQKVNGVLHAPLPLLIPQYLIKRLISLSLDALFKTLWFLGSTIECNIYQAPQKISKNPAQVDLVLNNAFKVLQNWPDAFFNKLNEFQRLPVEKNKTAIARNVYGPIHRFLIQDVTSNELVFIRSAYEIHINNIWRHANKRLPSSISKQMNLDLQEF